MSEVLKKKLELEEELKKITTNPTRKAVIRKYLGQLEKSLASAPHLHEYDKIVVDKTNIIK